MSLKLRELPRKATKQSKALFVPEGFKNGSMFTQQQLLLYAEMHRRYVFSTHLQVRAPSCFQCKFGELLCIVSEHSSNCIF